VSVKIQRESVASIWHEIQPLLVENQAETGWHDELGAVPSDEPFVIAEDAGTFVCFTARSANGQLVGYAGFWVVEHPHYRPGTLVAFCDAIYLAPSHRGADGVRLIRFTERELAALGCALTHQTVSPKRDHSRLLERLGYECTDITFAKRLET